MSQTQTGRPADWPDQCCTMDCFHAFIFVSRFSHLVGVSNVSNRIISWPEILTQKLKKYEQGDIDFMKQFLDDLIKKCVGTTKSLHSIFEEMNQIHPSMNNTSNSFEEKEDRCQCQDQQAISFLDTSCSIQKGRIVLDMYKKPTDRNMYLLPTSCHPPYQQENIPCNENKPNLHIS